MPHKLVISIGLFLVALALDFLQHVWRTIAWGVMARDREKKLDKKDGDQEVLDPPTWVNRVTLGFFATKVPAMIAGFVLLFIQAFAALWR